MTETRSWFKIKRYNHIGKPISLKEKHSVESYVKNEDKISHHAFFPLIKREIKKYRYKLNNETNKKVKRVKIRPICYATHLDSAIYSYYASIIYKKYETWLSEQNISECITAYRSEKCQDRHGNKCNIDFSKDVFDFIRLQTKKVDVTAIVFDIKGFFDNLDHKILKDSWKAVCGMDKMDDATYSVYKNVTKYSYIGEDELFKLFKDQIICKNSTREKQVEVKKKKYLRDKQAIAFCERTGINLIREKNIIHRGNFDSKNKCYTHKGIPQGLPISAVLANVYMMSFDKIIAQYISTLGGIYRRYSDDIIVVCPKENGVLIKNNILTKIKDKEVKLEIEVSKTNLFNFSMKSDGNIVCEHEKLGVNKKLEYLGFSFDGNTIRIKSSSLGAYYYKMSKNINRSIYFASHTKCKKYYGKIFENKLLRRFSKLGARKNKIYLRSKNNPSNFYDTEHRSFGNYWSYVKKSAKIMDSPAIEEQLKRNMNKLKTSIMNARTEVLSQISNKQNGFRSN
jgi:hypothetical protein